MKSPILLSLSFFITSSSCLLALSPEKAQEQTDLARRYVLGDGVEQDYAKAIELLTPAAKAGNLLAKHSLGYMYVEGMGVPFDTDRGFALITEAAEGGLARAQDALAGAYAFGEGGLKPDQKKSLYWMEKAMEQGAVGTLGKMVNIYSNGSEKIPADMKLANELLMKAATEGLAPFQMELGYRYLVGKGLKADIVQAVTWTKRAADQGIAGAMGNLAFMYMAGAPQLKRDYKKAYEWAEKGAKLGDASSYNVMAACLIDGLGREKNVEEGLKYMNQAAELGDVDALANLSTFYRLGKHVGEANPQKAFEYAKKAGELGHVDSMSTVAIFYIDGFGVEKNEQLCYEWTKRAAEAGHADAMSNMTFLYSRGVGAEKDPAKAFQWAERAAATGSPRGIYNLATIYMEGAGVKADAKKAVTLLEQAAERGYPDAYGLLIDYFSKGSQKDNKRVARYKKEAEELHQKRQKAQNISA